jgi:hypothetical protein
VSVAVRREVDPDVYVETCLGRVCDAIGIHDEGKRAALPPAEIEVDWEEPPGTLRLVPSPSPWPAHAPSGRVMPSGEYPVGTHAALAAGSVVPPPIATVRVSRRAPSRGVHPAVLLCAVVSIVAVAASYLWSPTPSASRVRAHTSALLGLASR